MNQTRTIKNGLHLIPRYPLSILAALRHHWYSQSRSNQVLGTVNPIGSRLLGVLQNWGNCVDKQPNDIPYLLRTGTYIISRRHNDALASSHPSFPDPSRNPRRDPTPMRAFGIRSYHNALFPTR
ncbi:hypothetical protein FIBSPDRAFT_847254 [Athelia psychrophila]|uniref:Uncharacterized protein n=1 Tax=Athelia psychrophila TaxID=1759441 RepID=A0A166WUA8_9AGAM|nr:hypothetical protein FIBSPDRAFT_847254 [Fibularhizoctonia sp. CBS 109695]